MCWWVYLTLLIKQVLTIIQTEGLGDPEYGCSLSPLVFLEQVADPNYSHGTTRDGKKKRKKITSAMISRTTCSKKDKFDKSKEGKQKCKRNV